MKFRLLDADEIECRVGTVSKGVGFSLLLYKDARCDMARLDEEVGAMNWQRRHKEVKGVCYCGVSINRNYMDESVPAEWVTKWDCGSESKTEKEKGESSDAFKRACVNWGIGRELYTAPFIWLYGEYDRNARYVVTKISYDENRKINGLEIVETKSGEVAYTFKNGRSSRGKTSKSTASKEEPKVSMKDVAKEDQVSTNEHICAHDRIVLFCNEHQLLAGMISEQYGIEKDMPEDVYLAKLSMLQKDYGEQ